MVEDLAADAAGRGEHQLDAFRVIDAAQLVIVVEIALRGRRLDKADALTVEIEPAGDRPHVVDRHGMRFRPPVAARRAGRRVVGQVVGFLRHRREVVQDAFDMGQAVDLWRAEAHR